MEDIDPVEVLPPAAEPSGLRVRLRRAPGGDALDDFLAVLPSGELAAASKAPKRQRDDGAAASKAPKRSPAAARVSASAAHAPGTQLYEFWRGVERVWDESNVPTIARKTPLMGNKPIDYFLLYQTVRRFGGYDIVNGSKGGWSAVYRDIPATGGEPADTSSSFRVKKQYERMLLEYERRVDAGSAGADAPPAADGSPPVFLTATEVLMPAGWGIAQSVADARKEGLAALARAIPRGDTAVIFADADAARRIERERQAAAARPAAAGGRGARPGVPGSAGVGAALDAAAAGAAGGAGDAAPPSAQGGGGAASAPLVAPAPPPPPPEPPRLQSEELFRSRVLAAPASIGLAFGSGSGRIRDPSALPLDAAVEQAAQAWYPSVRYLALPRAVAANLWGSSGAGGKPGLSPAEARGVHAAEALWRRDRTGRALAPLHYGVSPEEAAAHGHARRLHSRLCLSCGVAMKVLRAPAAAPRGDGSTEGDDDDATVDEEPTAAAAAAAVVGAPPLEGGGDAAAPLVSEAPPVAAAPATDAAAARARLAAAAARAWATCAGCANVACFPCLFPAPAAAGFEGPSAEAELSAFLASAAAASTHDGASSDAGSRRGLSDAGLWFCPPCTVVRGAAGVSLPWCGVCHTSVAAPPAFPDDSFFGCLASPVDFAAWPATVRCDRCSCKMHAQCAARAGVVVAEVGSDGAAGAPRLVGATQSESSALLALRPEATEAAVGGSSVGAAAGSGKYAFFCRPCSEVMGGSSGATKAGSGASLTVPTVRSGLYYAANGSTRETAALGKLM